MGRWWCLLLATAALVSCNSNPQLGRPVLRVSNWGGAGDDSDFDRQVQSLYRQFGEEHGCEVKIEGIPDGYVQKMVLNHIAGTMPDVMVLDASSAAIFINNGVLRDLSPLIAKDPEFKFSDYYPNVLDIGRRNGKTYAIPGDFTPMVMYYNKDIFDRAGIPYPTADWTFEKFFETAKKLTVREKSGKIQQYGFSFSTWMPGWIMWLWNNGGDVLSPDGKRASGVLDSPQNVETVQFLTKMAADTVQVNGQTVANPDQVSPSLSQAAASGVDLFANGQAAMVVNGHWALIGYKNAPKDSHGKPKIDWRRLGVVALPHNTPQSHTVMYEAGFAIPAKAKNLDLAWEYVKFWSSERLQKVYNASGIAVCARKDVSEERAVEPIEKEFIDIIPMARKPYGSWIEGYEFVERAGENALKSILNNGRDVKGALSYAAERIDKEFAKR
ncbi:MAG TPA: sugar ABC transporter substrate-binding protein [Fimbriimonadaceae bacterium]|nr:sugar ABC transporter substrate-binding protein [Fimbriimonadaceae bacterium]